MTYYTLLVNLLFFVSSVAVIIGLRLSIKYAIEYYQHYKMLKTSAKEATDRSAADQCGVADEDAADARVEREQVNRHIKALQDWTGTVHEAFGRMHTEVKGVHKDLLERFETISKLAKLMQVDIMGLQAKMASKADKVTSDDEFAKQAEMTNQVVRIARHEAKKVVEEFLSGMHQAQVTDNKELVEQNFNMRHTITKLQQEKNDLQAEVERLKSLNPQGLQIFATPKRKVFGKKKQ